MGAERKGVIALDFDGCIAYGADVKIKYARKVFGLELHSSNTAEECFPLGRKRYREMMDVVGSECIGEYGLAPMCREVMAELTGNGFEFVVITSRNNRELYAAEYFIAAHCLPVSGVRNTNNMSKRDACLELGATALLDDTLGKLLEVEGAEVKGACIALYFLNQPWNLHEHAEACRLSGLERLICVNNWQDFGAHLLKAFG